MCVGVGVVGICVSWHYVCHGLEFGTGTLLPPLGLAAGAFIHLATSLVHKVSFKNRILGTKETAQLIKILSALPET